jgi:glutamate-ammonia-ligase adenylyltransferase
VLYEIDLRLRPSGNKGPVATHIEAFRQYQRENAWTWEHMALTRARVIAGDTGLMEAAEAEIGAILAAKRDPAKVFDEALKMRELIEAEKPPASIWDIKLIPGGIIDLEFIAQTAVLTGRTGDGARETETAVVLSRLSPSHVPPQVREELEAAHRLYATVTQIVRLCLEGRIDPDDIPPGLADLLLRSTDLPDLSVLEADIRETSRRVRHHFRALLAGAADQA